MFSNCTLDLSLVQRTMEAHECRGSAPPRGDQGTGTQGSSVGRRSRLVDGDREFRVADHPQVPDLGLAPRKTQTGKMASEQQAVPPLTSTTLRGMPHHAAEVGFILPGLRPDLPGLSVTSVWRTCASTSRALRRAASWSSRAAVGNELFRP